MRNAISVTKRFTTDAEFCYENTMQTLHARLRWAEQEVGAGRFEAGIACLDEVSRLVTEASEALRSPLMKTRGIEPSEG